MRVIRVAPSDACPDCGSTRVRVSPPSGRHPNGVAYCYECSSEWEPAPASTRPKRRPGNGGLRGC